MAARAARSWTKSKTSSRGAEMVVRTVTARTAADSMRPARRSGGPWHHGSAAGAPEAPPAADGGAAFCRKCPEAELAQHAAGVELEQPRAGERRAAALLAVVSAAGDGPEAGAQQHGAHVRHGDPFCARRSFPASSRPIEKF